jgi:flagellar basal body-associated protein FliL
MAERQEETLQENHIEVEKVQESAEQDAEESAALKERSRTESDGEGPGAEEPPQEESRAAPPEDGIPGKAGRSGTRKYVMAAIFLMCMLIGISGGLLIWKRYFSSPESVSPAAQGYSYDLKPFFVPLSKSGSKKFLRVTITLELPGRNSSQQIVKNIEEVRSSILKLLLNTPGHNDENAQWKDLLAAEITSALNLLAEGNVVKGVIFKDLLVI